MRMKNAMKPTHTFDKTNFAISNEYNELRTKVHDRLLDMLDLSLIDTLGKDRLKQEIRGSSSA